LSLLELSALTFMSGLYAGASAFKYILQDKKMLDNIMERIYSAGSEDEDSVRLYVLCGHCIGSVVIVGKGEVSRDRDVYII
jgi:CRISPR/Cas system-associated endoribonuclease Cas2